MHLKHTSRAEIVLINFKYQENLSFYFLKGEKIVDDEDFPE